MQNSSKWNDGFVLGAIFAIVFAANSNDPGYNVFIAILFLPSLFVLGAMLLEDFLEKK